jgi:hypothetical protein
MSPSEFGERAVEDPELPGRRAPGPLAEAGGRRPASGVSFGARAVGWIESEVDEWIRERIEESRDGAA